MLHSPEDYFRTQSLLVDKGELPPSALTAEIFTYSPYAKTHHLAKEQIVRGLLSSATRLPYALDNDDEPAARHTSRTQHGARPTTINFRQNPELIAQVYSKPFNDLYRARREFNNNQIALARGVPTVTPIALIAFPKTQFVITETDHRFLPFSSQDLTWRERAVGIESPEHFLHSLVRFVARDIHDKGIVHQDLNFGNLGLRFKKKSALPEFFVIDWELSMSLLDDGIKWLRRPAVAKGDRAEVGNLMEFYNRSCIVDILQLIAGLVSRGFPVPWQDMADVASESYAKSRKFIYDPKGEFFPDLRNQLYELLEASSRHTSRLTS